MKNLRKIFFRFTSDTLYFKMLNQDANPFQKLFVGVVREKCHKINFKFAHL